MYAVTDGAWIAADRRWKAGQGMDLFRSEDDGRSWILSGELTEAKKHPGHLTRLKSGDLLLTYGNRVEHGVAIKVSSDQGMTWSEEKQLVHLDQGDVGYPSSVQMENGDIVTAYYSSGIASHNRYHMGVIIWRI
ncbi:MAG: exo-alpha-sialidase [Saprospiraceae bacterium]|nr:exo-alpha-sialidase [Saprospiraceae bacterium]